MKNKLEKIIAYLEGKLDIYDGNHHDIISYWDQIWDEMKWMGYNPELAIDIKKYAKVELGYSF